MPVTIDSKIENFILRLKQNVHSPSKIKIPSDIASDLFKLDTESDYYLSALEIRQVDILKIFLNLFDSDGNYVNFFELRLNEEKVYNRELWQSFVRHWRVSDGDEEFIY